MGKIRKSLLILSGGKEAIEGIKIAKEMGLNVIICDRNKNAPGRKFADDFIVADIYNEKEALCAISKYARKHKIDGVITIASDAVRTVAAVAEHFDLSGVSRKTAFLATDKYEMKKCFKNNLIPTAKFVGVLSKKDLEKGMKKFTDAVLKPVDSRGSRGVLRINKNTDLNEAFNYSIQFSPSKKLILEEWLKGPQLSTESIVIDGKTHLCGVADRNYSNANSTYPYIIEDGGETPSKYSPRINEKLNVLIDKVAKSISIKNGIIKGDIVLKNNEPYVIEVATRLSGGFFSTITIPLVYHINIVEKAIQLALNEKIEPPKKLRNYCFQANRFFFVHPGTIKKISKYNSKKMPKYVKFFECTAKIGEHIQEIQNHTMRKGSVLVYAKTRQKAIKRSIMIRDKIKIEIHNKKIIYKK